MPTIASSATCCTCKRTDKYVRQTRSQCAAADHRAHHPRKGRAERPAATRSRHQSARAPGARRDSSCAARKSRFAPKTPKRGSSKAFQTLVDKVYTNLPHAARRTMPKPTSASSSRKARRMFGGLATALTEAEQEISTSPRPTRASASGRRSRRSSRNSSGSPMAGPMHAILCADRRPVRRAASSRRRSDGARSEGDALERGAAATRTQLPNIVLELQVEFTPAQVRKLKEFFKEFFDAPPAAPTPRRSGRDEAKLDRRRERDREPADRAQSRATPSWRRSKPLQTALREVVGKPYGWYLTDWPPRGRLLDPKEDVFGPVKRFMGGAQKAIYDEARGLSGRARRRISAMAATTRPARSGQFWPIPTASRAARSAS